MDIGVLSAHVVMAMFFMWVTAEQGAGGSDDEGDTSDEENPKPKRRRAPVSRAKKQAEQESVHSDEDGSNDDVSMPSKRRRTPVSPAEKQAAEEARIGQGDVWHMYGERRALGNWHGITAIRVLVLGSAH